MAQPGTTENTKKSKSKHTNSRRMPSGAHTKRYMCTVNIPYFLMPNTTRSAKQTDKKYYRGIHHIEHCKTELPKSSILMKFYITSLIKSEENSK